MKIDKIISWLDRTLDVRSFDDVSNNGLQIARNGDEVKHIAFGVDASVEFIEAAAAAGAEMAVVHHGISWGGGIKRVVGSEYAVIAAAMRHNIALYAVHLPLDANHRCGNNYEMARYFGLKQLTPAFSYHGNVIGVIGTADRKAIKRIADELPEIDDFSRRASIKVGICSGGAAEFAGEAQELGCDLFLTGEASWGDVIAAQNTGASLVCLGHYDTEVFGPSALAKLLKRELKVDSFFVDTRHDEHCDCGCH